MKRSFPQSAATALLVFSCAPLLGTDFGDRAAPQPDLPHVAGDVVSSSAVVMVTNGPTRRSVRS